MAFNWAASNFRITDDSFFVCAYKFRMSQLSEIKKLFSIFSFLFKTVIKAIGSNDQISKTFLANLYLRSLADQSRIPSVSIAVRDTDIFVVSALRYLDTDRRMEDRFALLSDYDLYSLLALLQQKNPKSIFEFGFMRGGTFYHYFLNSKENTTVHSLDMNPHNMPVMIKQLMAENPQLKLHVGNSLQLDTAPFAGQMDFIYIDGAHDYETVKVDTANAIKMLSPGGLIVWDDYNPASSGVFNCVNEFASNSKNVFHIKGTKLAFWDQLRSIKTR